MNTELKGKKQHVGFLIQASKNKKNSYDDNQVDLE